MARSRRRPRINPRAKWRMPDPPRTIQLRYYRALMAYTTRVASLLQEIVLPVARSEADLAAQAQGIRAVDALSPRLDQALAEFVHRVTGLDKSAIDAASKAMVAGIEVFQRETFVSNIKRTIGVDIGAIVSQPQVAETLNAARRANFDLIRTIGDNYSERARRIIERGMLTGRSGADVQQDLLDLGGFKERYQGTEERRARVIVRDQTQKLMKDIDHTRQRKLGVRHFVWVTVGDERVRDRHEAYGGHRFAYDDPPDGVLPGDDVQCRCHARPDLDELLTSLETGSLGE